MAETMSAEDVLGRVREWAGRNPATERLLAEGEQYLKAQGKRLLEKASAGGAGGGAIGKGAKALAQGGSPVAAAGQAVTEGAKNTIGGLLGRGKDRSGQAKATIISESIEVGVPVSTAYNQWTQYPTFSAFMKGVESVDASDEVTTSWHVKIGPSRRTWEGHVSEQIPDRRIRWESQGAKGHANGVVTFHPLCDDLTHIGVVIEYFPAGVVEKTGNLFHLAGRRVRIDLQRFRRFIMMEGAETGAWRGEIRDGHVVRGNGGQQNGRTRTRDGARAQGGKAQARR